MIPNQDQTNDPAPANGDEPATLRPGPTALKEAKDSAEKSSTARGRNSKTKTRQRAATKPSSKATSKQDKVLSLLRRKEGASITAIMKAIGWQKHSVHGFLAGVVRKKLSLNLKSDKVDGKRIYRIVPGKPAKTAAPKRERSR